MTSTPFNIGLRDGRLSSRVLRPPGGGHTDIFGGEPEPPRGRRPAPATQISLGQGEEPAKPINGTEASSLNTQAGPEVTQETHQAPEPLQEAKSESALSAAAAPAANTNKQQEEPPKRVRVPPGGFSSLGGLW